MEDFFKKNYIWLAVIAILLIFLITKNSSNSVKQNTFNSKLVTEKQKCQEAFTKYNANNGYTGIRAHFNANLNTCLVDDLYNRPDGIVQTSSVIDIYDGSRKLLELDIFLKPEAGIAVGQYLYENGKKINVLGDVLKEYDKRRAVLFEEPTPNY